MTLREYQEKAMTTCMDASRNFSYMFLNLVGEVGEFASKVAKAIRKGKMAVGCIKPNALNYTMKDSGDIHYADTQTLELKKECGDIMWQLFGLMAALGWDAEEIAQMNLDKLAGRKDRGVIDGNGDNR